MRRCFWGAVLSLAMLCGCAGAPSSTATGDSGELERLLDAQIGLLAPFISEEERGAAMEILKELRPIQLNRIQRGEYKKSEREQRLIRRLNALYESYTVAYLNPDSENFGYESPPWQTIAAYQIEEEGELTQNRPGSPRDWEEKELLELWEGVCGWMPENAFDHFDQLVFFTDGEYETVAYVVPLDAGGRRWEFGLDPADAGDETYLIETVLHEYFHSVSLNDQQVKYTARQNVDTYNEEGMVTFKGSYLDDFYQKFWVDYLDDCLACEDTFNFFLRHENDFVTAYASTDPSEDLCESFAYFVLHRIPRGDEVWQQKLNFFQAYPELVEFRQTVREHLLELAIPLS